MAHDAQRTFRTIAKEAEVREDRPIVVEINGTSIGVVRFRGRLHAFRNSCPHQGGPVAEGDIVGNVECRVMEGGRRDESISDRNFNIACPWHGIEYDLETGICRSDSRMRLRSYELVVEDGLVKIRV